MWISQVLFRVMGKLLIGACLEDSSDLIDIKASTEILWGAAARAGRQMRSHADVLLIPCVLLDSSPKHSALFTLFDKWSMCENGDVEEMARLSLNF